MMAKPLVLGVLLVFVGSSREALPSSQQPAPAPTLAAVVKARPFQDYGTWWRIGPTFSTLMSNAILTEWRALPGNGSDLATVRRYVSEYIKTVYHREARLTLVDDFASGTFSTPLQSGEFDALSYSFFRSAFELIAGRATRTSGALEAERRLFTRQVGKRFFASLHDRLGLQLPTRLDDEKSVVAFKASVDKVLAFLTREGYFRDRAAFRLDVNVPRKSGRIEQREASVPQRLQAGERVYGLFEMSYPVILPSAVYLFQTIGEAQHHSSRTIEELFGRMGYVASETSDFDPSGFPSDLVVELWEIRRQ